MLKVEDWYEVVYDPLNGAIFTDLSTDFKGLLLFHIEYLRNDIR